MAKGGRRAGAGRPKGSRNKRSVQQEEEIRNSGQTPLEYFVSIYQDEKQPERMRLEAARSAAPYVHPKLSAMEMEMSTAQKDPVEMTEAELIADIAAAKQRLRDSGNPLRGSTKATKKPVQPPVVQ